VAVIETDKVAIDVRATRAGLVTAILTSVGDEVCVRQPLYTLDVEAPPPRADSTEEERERTWARTHEQQKERERMEAEALWREHQQRQRREPGHEHEHEGQWQRGFGGGSGASGTSSRSGRWPGAHHFRFRRSGGRGSVGAGPRTSPAPGGARLASGEVRTMALDQLVDRTLRLARRADYHGCLGLAPGAEPVAVRRRYLALALRLHPDHAKHPQAREAFTAMDDAFRRVFRPRTGYR
jgi:pyruvate/2-oxoglutarate dehydrogenase complex dihydrolipoamide acyltransferase (E2) component